MISGFKVVSKTFHVACLSYLVNERGRKKDLERLALRFLVSFHYQEFKPYFNLGVTRQITFEQDTCWAP